MARDFGPLALKAVRDLMIKGYDHPDYGPQEALSRGCINQRIGKIKRAFKWAVANQFVPADVLHGLQAVAGLHRGRSEARETEPVKPVPQAFVDATIAAAGPIIADMIRLQLLTGIRPGELVIDARYRPGHDRPHLGVHAGEAQDPASRAFSRHRHRPPGSSHHPPPSQGRRSGRLVLSQGSDRRTTSGLTCETQDEGATLPGLPQIGQAKEIARRSIRRGEHFWWTLSLPSSSVSAAQFLRCPPCAAVRRHAADALPGVSDQPCTTWPPR